VAFLALPPRHIRSLHTRTQRHAARSLRARRDPRRTPLFGDAQPHTPHVHVCLVYPFAFTLCPASAQESHPEQPRVRVRASETRIRYAPLHDVLPAQPLSHDPITSCRIRHVRHNATPPLAPVVPAVVSVRPSSLADPHASGPWCAPLLRRRRSQEAGRCLTTDGSGAGGASPPAAKRRHSLVHAEGESRCTRTCELHSVDR